MIQKRATYNIQKNVCFPVPINGSISNCLCVKEINRSGNIKYSALNENLNGFWNVAQAIITSNHKTFIKSHLLFDYFD